MSILKHSVANSANPVSKMTGKLTGVSPLLAGHLTRIADPPQQLFYRGNIDLLQVNSRPRVAIVGSRKISPYGKRVTNQLTRRLSQQGIVIVSGLALGVDSVAHRATLEAGGKAIAVLPSSLDKIYPASHWRLAKQITEQGGLLLSEYEDSPQPMKYQFIARNRLIAAFSEAVVIPEAALNSGSRHTANFALEQGKPVLAVPGNIDSPTSAGTNNLIKTGAIPVTSPQDIFHALGVTIPKSQLVQGSTPEETIILQLLQNGQQETAQLLQQSQLEPAIFNQTLTMLEITGKIRSLGASQWILD